MATASPPLGGGGSSSDDPRRAANNTVKMTADTFVSAGMKLFEGAYVTDYSEEAVAWEIEMAWVCKHDPGRIPSEEWPPLDLQIEYHLIRVKAVPLTDSSFFYECSVLQHDEVQVQGRQTNLSDFALFEPVMFFVKAPSAYSVATACSLEGWATRTAAYRRSEDMVLRAIEEYHVIRDLSPSARITSAVKSLFAAECDTEHKEFHDAITGKLIGVEKTLHARLKPRLVSAMRLATRVLRGTRAQISDVHARTTAQHEFTTVIDSICNT